MNIAEHIDTLRSKYRQSLDQKKVRRPSFDTEKAYVSNSIDLDILVKPKTKEKKEGLVKYVKKNQKSKFILVDPILDQTNIQEYEYKIVSFPEFVQMMNGTKKQVKSIVKNHKIVVHPTKAPSVLKNFGRTFQKYKKTPFIATKVNKALLAQVSEKENLKITKNRTQLKLGRITESTKVLELDFTNILDAIDQFGVNVVRVIVKISKYKGAKVSVTETKQ
jgi:hypothetical protein